jgi:carbamate kinase
MIGYLVEQELMNALPPGTRCATLLTQIEVARDHPAFAKPIGPDYTAAEAAQIGDAHGWAMIEETEDTRRRVVPSPLLLRITQIDAIRLLVPAGRKASRR